VTAAVVAACFVNPYGLRGATFPEYYRKAIVELQSLGDFVAHFGKKAFYNPYLIMHLATLVIGIVSFLVLIPSRRLVVFRLLLFAAFAHLGWQALRNNNHFALVTACVATWNFSDAWQRRHWFRLDGDSLGRWFVAAGRLMLGGMLTAMTIAVVNDSFYDFAAEGRNFGLGERRNWFAHDACRFLGRPGMPMRAFMGDFIQVAVHIFHNGPQHKVFIDGRLEVNSKETLEQYFEILKSMARRRSDWISLIQPPEGNPEDSILPAVLLDSRRNREAIEGLLGLADWRCVYCDEAASVFLSAPVADSLRLPPADISPLLRTPDDPADRKSS
jgi:hypothetical protein